MKNLSFMSEDAIKTRTCCSYRHFVLKKCWKTHGKHETLVFRVEVRKADKISRNQNIWRAWKSILKLCLLISSCSADEFFFCNTRGCVYKMLMIRNQRHYVKRFTFVSPSAVFFSCSSYLLLLPRLCRREAKLEHFFFYSCVAASTTACGLCESDSFLI